MKKNTNVPIPFALPYTHKCMLRIILSDMSFFVSRLSVNRSHTQSVNRIFQCPAAVFIARFAGVPKAPVMLVKYAQLSAITVDCIARAVWQSIFAVG